VEEKQDEPIGRKFSRREHSWKNRVDVEVVMKHCSNGKVERKL
jgi:hypothetical protein